MKQVRGPKVEQNKRWFYKDVRESVLKVFNEAGDWKKAAMLLGLTRFG